MAENTWSTLSNELARAAEQAGPSVVGVQGWRYPASGVFWSSDSIVTVNHAVRADEARIVLANGERISGRVGGRDPGTDLAVLRIESRAEAGQSRWSADAKLRIGELTLALARTWRGNIVASSGIVSGLMPGPWRTRRGGELDQFIRPDLTMYPGFSGGPLLNSQGELVGINTQGLHRSGITIPATTVARIAAELREKGRVERPYLGLAMHNVTLPESLRSSLNLTSGEGLLVVHVEPESPAGKAGVLLGDTLVELESKAVGDTDGVQDALRSRPIGSEVELLFIRGGAAKKVRLKLAARPAG
jgi:S1-C subfamily serine protease